MLAAERIDLGLNLVADATRLRQPFLVRAGEFRRIVEGPMKSGSDTWKDWTAFCFRFATDGDDKLKHLT